MPQTRLFIHTRDKDPRIVEVAFGAYIFSKGAAGIRWHWLNRGRRAACPLEHYTHLI